MTDTTDPIAAARALIEPLTGYTRGRWQCSRADLASYDADTGAQVSYLYPGDGERVRFETDNPVEDARLAAAAPDLRDMVATLTDAVEVERAKVAAAFAMQDAGYSMTTPADAQAALDKLLAEARLEGWRAGRDAAADHCWAKRDLLADAEKKQVAAGLSGRDYYGRRLEAELLSRSIRAMHEPKEASHD